MHILINYRYQNEPIFIKILISVRSKKTPFQAKNQSPNQPKFCLNLSDSIQNRSPQIMPTISHEVFIASESEKIYTTLTSQSGLSAWWTDATLNPHSHTIRFAFGDYYKEMQITQSKPFESIGWLCVAGADEWIGTSVLFQLESANKQTILHSHPEIQSQLEQSPSDQGTLLTFQHSDWKAQTPMFAECNYTWAQFLRSLKRYCETGKGNPWPNQHR